VNITVLKDGSERGKKYFLLWNPSFIDKTKNVRRSVHQETKDLFVFNVSHKMQTLCFTISRQMAELLTRWSRETLKEKTPRLVEAVTAYRAGYLPEERRDIERNIRNKKIIGVASTNALELGIDIGSLDSVIISGYPGTIISTWQQAGRTGRTMKDSLATLVAFQNPLDQYFMKHPKDLFSRTHEHAIIDLENPYIVMGHLICASAELPITENDKKYFPSFFKESLEVLERKTLVRRTPISWVLVTVTCNGKILETMDMTKAYNEAYEGAVLLNQGDTYIVENLDLDNLNATVKQQNVDYYTEPKKIVDIKIKNVFKEKNVKTEIGIGDVEVTEFYHNYVLKTYNEVIGRRLLNLPPLKFSTVGIWFTIPQQVLEEIEDLNLDFEGGLHAVEHAMIAMTPFYAMCDRWDVGGVSTFMHIDTGKPTIFIYDGFEGGIGISEKIYELIEKLFETTLRLIRDCECEEGCPSCIYSAKCGNENQPLDKEAAIHILDKITQRAR
jgi:DEAD/DEAH box helicase domain-containing protein